MDLKQYWQIVWKHRWWVLTAIALVVTGVGAYAFTATPIYRATSKLLLERGSKVYANIDSGPRDGSEFKSVSTQGNPIDTHVELIKSDAIVSRVIARLDLSDAAGAPMTPAQFMRRAFVVNVKATDMVQLAYEDSDPARAQEVVNAWARVVVADNVATNSKEARVAVRLISSQLEKTKKELARAEVALRDYRQTHRAIDLSEQARSSIASIAAVEADLRAADAASRASRARAEGLRRQLGLSSSQALAATAVSQDPSVMQLRQQLLAAETAPALSDTSLGSEHPSVKSAQAQVEALRRRLAQQASRVLGRQIGTGSMDAAIDPVRQGLTRDLVQAEVEALSNQTRLESMRTLVSSYNGRLDSLPNAELHLTRLSRNAAVLGETYKMLVTKLEEARFKESISAGYVRIVDLAALPASPVRPMKAFMLAIALGVGAVLGLGIALFLDYLDDTIQTVDDAEAALALPVLAIVPWMRKRENTGVVALKQPRSAFAESYRTLRTNIRFLAGPAVRTLVVTSAGPGEGKSTTIANLAAVLSLSGKRVLLVDADMRRPTIHGIYQLPNDRGLSTILTGGAALEDLVKVGPNDHLHVLPSGPAPVDPAELLESPAMATLLEQARAKYDLVLFDAPPVIAVTDACVLGARVDGVMMLVGLNKVTHKAARHAFKLLQAANVRVWGMVLRGMRPDNDPYYNTYYHSYTNTAPEAPAKRAAP